MLRGRAGRSPVIPINAKKRDSGNSFGEIAKRFHGLVMSERNLRARESPPREKHRTLSKDVPSVYENRNPIHDL